MLRLLGAALVSSCLAAAQPPPGDLAAGKKLFEAHCAPCHGIDGTGGRGANLTLPQLKRAGDRQAFFDIAKNGIEGTSMDGAWQLSDAELWRVVAYGRSLGATARAALPGDPALGKLTYQKLGCSGCHIVNGQGRGFGPELTAIGARRSAAYLRESILDPGANVPEDFVLMQVKTIDGRGVQGLRVNEDSFTVQIKDSGDRFWSFQKSNLASIERQPGKSAMPSYAGRLSPEELDDLAAYLAGLRGEP